ncbi:MAG: GntR family transcriptional regulator [Terriglobia bacterium]
MKIADKNPAVKLGWASLSERAYGLIREKILRGEVPLGAALSRRKLAAEYGMSFLPISEAIQRLEHEGLVESRPRVGTRVRIPTPRDVRDCYILREALECQAARLFVEKASSRERLELRRMAVRVDAMLHRTLIGPATADSHFRAQAYHLSFHMRVADCAGSAGLCDAIEREHVLIFNWLYDISTKVPNPPQRHTELMEALSGKSAEAAERAMRKHIRYGLEEIQAAIASRFSLKVPRARGLFELHRSPSSNDSRQGAWRLRSASPVASS